MAIGLLLEGLVAILLVTTIVYCFLLDRRLRALRNGQDGLKDLVKALNETTQRAQSSVAQLKIAGAAAGKDLQDLVQKGRALADELSLMIEAGNNIADRLAGTATGSSKAQTPDEGEAEERSLEQAMGDDREKLWEALREAR